jgi:hypothetical protein
VEGKGGAGSVLAAAAGEATRGAEADAVSASRLDGEPEARVAAALRQCGDSGGSELFGSSRE